MNVRIPVRAGLGSAIVAGLVIIGLSWRYNGVATIAPTPGSATGPFESY